MTFRVMITLPDGAICPLVHPRVNFRQTILIHVI